MTDTEVAIGRLAALKRLGVRLAIDDFGTGYSSLGYLRRFQVDILKIARDFIGSADGGSEDWAFAHAIVALGRTLDLRIVAEGVEQPGQLQRLRKMGCEFGQGFLFARPVDGVTFTADTFGERRESARVGGPVTQPSLAIQQIDLRSA